MSKKSPKYPKGPGKCPVCDVPITWYAQTCLEHRPSAGSSNGRWTGGRKRSKDGYIEIWTPDHPFRNANSRVREHRLVMEQHLGRYLRSDETVHHINGDRTDNRIENLELWGSGQPPGQRVKDRVIWAKEILRAYEAEALAQEERS